MGSNVICQENMAWGLFDCTIIRCNGKVYVVMWGYDDLSNNKLRIKKGKIYSLMLYHKKSNNCWDLII